MNLINAIKLRCSVRDFKPDPIPKNIINEMLEAARLAPSGGNAQSHYFGIVTDRELKVKLAKAAGNQMWIASAPVIFACCADISWDMAESSDKDFGLEVNKLRFGDDLINYLSAYSDRKAICTLFQNAAPLIPAEHIFLTATSHGLGGCFVGYLDVEEASNILNLPSNMVCLFLLPVGYPAQVSQQKEKKPVQEISFYNQFINNKLQEVLCCWEIDKPYKIVNVDVDNTAKRQQNAWFINDIYFLKKGTNIDHIHKQINISKVLSNEGLPVAIPVKTKDCKDYIVKEGEYYCLFPRLKGEGVTDYFSDDYLRKARTLGEVIGRLHMAFVKCDNLIICKENNIYTEVANWAIPIVKKAADKHGLHINSKLFDEYLSGFCNKSDQLPTQIIHRDMHGQNLLFYDGNFAGYVDFELSQRNIRIFDPCYMGTGILSGCINDASKCEKWVEVFTEIVKGYDSICILSENEKTAIIYTLYSIQLICIAFFSQNGYDKLVESNIKALNWIYENRKRLEVL